MPCKVHCAHSAVLWHSNAIKDCSTTKAQFSLISFYTWNYGSGRDTSLSFDSNNKMFWCHPENKPHFKTIYSTVYFGCIHMSFMLCYIHLPNLFFHACFSPKKPHDTQLHLLVLATLFLSRISFCPTGKHSDKIRGVSYHQLH